MGHFMWSLGVTRMVRMMPYMRSPRIQKLSKSQWRAVWQAGDLAAMHSSRGWPVQLRPQVAFRAMLLTRAAAALPLSLKESQAYRPQRVSAEPHSRKSLPEEHSKSAVLESSPLSASRSK